MNDYSVDTEMAKLRGALRVLRNAGRERKMLVKSQMFGQVGLGNVSPELIPQIEDIAPDDFPAMIQALENRYLACESSI